MGISGQGGSVGLDSNGYDEPPRGQEGANHMTTDYAQDPSVKQTRRSAFDEGKTT
jgi:hypothetical protein